MKKHLSCLLLATCLLGHTDTQADSLLFEIGKKDNSAAEFALAPNHYRDFLMHFSGVKHLQTGPSGSERHWPYALPLMLPPSLKGFAGPLFLVIVEGVRGRHGGLRRIPYLCHGLRV